jgi:hypothetical protein
MFYYKSKCFNSFHFQSFSSPCQNPILKAYLEWGGIFQTRFGVKQFNRYCRLNLRIGQVSTKYKFSMKISAHFTQVSHLAPPPEYLWL